MIEYAGWMWLGAGIGTIVGLTIAALIIVLVFRWLDRREERRKP